MGRTDTTVCEDGDPTGVYFWAHRQEEPQLAHPRLIRRDAVRRTPTAPPPLRHATRIGTTPPLIPTGLARQRKRALEHAATDRDLPSVIVADDALTPMPEQLGAGPVPTLRKRATLPPPFARGSARIPAMTDDDFASEAATTYR